MKAFPSKQKVRISDGVLEYVTSGVGRPFIVLLNGGSVSLEGWFRVYAEIGKLGTVFAYNRFGVGGSDRSTKPQTGEGIVSSLREMLVAAGLQPPYVLAGHSLGGLYANLYARLFPQEVVGIVLVEATHPKDVELLPSHETLLTRAITKGLGFLDAIFGQIRPSETKYTAETTARQIAQAGPFPDMPLIVVTGGKSPPTWLVSPVALEIRGSNQRDFLRMSVNSKQVIAEKSGHCPLITEPEIVVRAIREVVLSTKSKELPHAT